MPTNIKFDVITQVKKPLKLKPLVKPKAGNKILISQLHVTNKLEEDEEI